MLKFFRLPFATTGDKTAVPDAVDSNGNVSYSQGYGFDYQRQKTDPAAKNIERDKMNQILFDMTTAIAELQSQGVPDFITTALNGGTAYSYAQYAVVKYSGDLYISLVAANTALPSDATKWALLPTPARIQAAFNSSAVAAGTADALTGAFTPAIAALPAAPGTLSVLVRAGSVNTTTTPTFKADGTTAKTIVKGNGLPLVAGDIAGAGHWLDLQYDATLDKWVLQNPAMGVNSTRLRLSANTTFYVATTGNDSNNGLSVGSPFLTIQKAVTTIYENYDLAGFVATIQLADGTYTAGATLNGLPVGYRLGNAPIVLQGNSGTPSNTVISVTGGNCIAASASAILQVQNVKLQTTTSGNCLIATYHATILCGTGLVFGAAAGSHNAVTSAGIINFSSNYTIVGGAVRHWNGATKGLIYAVGLTITLTGTPAFTYFADFSDLSMASVFSNTFSGSATGVRYVLTVNSAINTNGGGANYLPGNSAGSAASGGQYV